MRVEMSLFKILAIALTLCVGAVRAFVTPSAFAGGESGSLHRRSTGGAPITRACSRSGSLSMAVIDVSIEAQC